MEKKFELLSRLKKLVPDVPYIPLEKGSRQIAKELLGLTPTQPFSRLRGLEIVQSLSVPFHPNQEKMKQKDPVLRNESSKVSWNIDVKTPHATAYRLWTRQSGASWQIIAEGILSDDTVDAGEFDAIRGTEFAYWLGIGSDKPQSRFHITIALAQDNFILVNGFMHENGKVNADGIAQRQETVTFK